EDKARRLLMELDGGQREKAVIAAVAPKELLTGSKPRISASDPEGLPASAMNSTQRLLLHDLIDVYVANVSGDAERERRAQIAAAGDVIYFSWMGSDKPGHPHYYRVQAPSF